MKYIVLQGHACPDLDCLTGLYLLNRFVFRHATQATTGMRLQFPDQTTILRIDHGGMFDPDQGVFDHHFSGGARSATQAIAEWIAAHNGSTVTVCGHDETIYLNQAQLDAMHTIAQYVSIVDNKETWDSAYHALATVGIEALIQILRRQGSDSHILTEGGLLIHALMDYEIRRAQRRIDVDQVSIFTVGLYPWAITYHMGK